MSKVYIYTIGQGSRRLCDLVAELQSRSVRYLCDVRSVPISNHAPEFCRDEFKTTLGEHSIVYVALGDTLGGRPTDRTIYASDGRVNYERLIASPDFIAGLDRVIRGALSGHRMAIFCSEGRPEQCHRSKAIGRALDERGIGVMHIDIDGTEIDQPSTMDRLAPPPTLLDVPYVDPRNVSRRTYK